MGLPRPQQLLVLDPGCPSAFLAWVVANVTGLPFWAAFVLLAVLGIAGFVLVSLFD